MSLFDSAVPSPLARAFIHSAMTDAADVGGIAGRHLPEGCMCMGAACRPGLEGPLRVQSRQERKERLMVRPWSLELGCLGSNPSPAISLQRVNCSMPQFPLM